MCPYVIISDILMEELSINRNTHIPIHIHTLTSSLPIYAH